MAGLLLAVFIQIYSDNPGQRAKERYERHPVYQRKNTNIFKVVDGHWGRLSKDRQRAYDCKKKSTLNSETAQEAKVLDVRSNDLCSRLGAVTVGEENPASCPLIYTHAPCMHISASTCTNENKGKPCSLHWKNRKVFLGHDPTYPRLQGTN